MYTTEKKNIFHVIFPKHSIMVNNICISKRLSSLFLVPGNGMDRKFRSYKSLPRVRHTLRTERSKIIIKTKQKIRTNEDTVNKHKIKSIKEEKKRVQTIGIS